MTMRVTLSSNPTSISGRKRRARFKQLIRQHGDVWEMIGEPEPMQCFDNRLGVRIRSLNGTHERNVEFDDVI